MKLGILEHTLKLLGKKPFDDLHVEEICRRVKISKVTMFKYFPQKEDILLYYFRIWCLRRAIELNDRPREGIQAIIYLFDKLGETFDEHPGLVLSFFGYLSDMKRTHKPFPVKAEEKVLLFPQIPNVASIEIQSIAQMLEKFTLEAIFKKEITKSASTRDITNLLSALFHGSVVTAHVHQITNLKFFFRKNIELLVKGL